MAEQVDPVAEPLREAMVEDIDPDVLVPEQGIGGAEQEDGAEELPLHLEPGIGRHVEDLADHGVAGGDHDRDQDQPSHPAADPAVEGVDPGAQPQQSLHSFISLIETLLQAPASGLSGSRRRRSVAEICGIVIGPMRPVAMAWAY